MRKLWLAGLVLGLGVTSVASAQTLGLPVFQSPYRAFKSNELGATISDPGDGLSWALEGQYRRADRRGRFDWGLRVAYADPQGPGGDGVFGLGVDVRAPLARHTQDFPMDASFTAGFGALFSNGSSGFLVPFGVTLGRQIMLENSSISFVPYVHPVLAPTFGDLSDGVQFGLGLGVDINLSRSWDARIGGSVGDFDGFGVGFAWHR